MRGCDVRIPKTKRRIYELLYVLHGEMVSGEVLAEENLDYKGPVTSLTSFGSHRTLEPCQHPCLAIGTISRLNRLLHEWPILTNEVDEAKTTRMIQMVKKSLDNNPGPCPSNATKYRIDETEGGVIIIHGEPGPDGRRR